jgi:hypothetical protein
MKIPFDFDPLTGSKSWFIDGEGDDFQILTETDVQPVIDRNKSLQNYGGGDGKDYWRAGDNMRHEASIPIGVQMEWMTKHGVDVMNPAHMDGVVKLLNDPEYRYLKTANVRI